MPSHPPSDTVVPRRDCGSGRILYFSRSLHLLAEPRALFPLLGLMTVIAIWSITTRFVAGERDDANQAARYAVTSQLETYRSQMVRALEDIDRILKTVQHVYELQGGSISLADLGQRGLLPTSLFNVGLANGDGHIIASTLRWPDGRAPLAESFRLGSTRDGLSISRLPAAGEHDTDKLLFTRQLPGLGGQRPSTAFVAIDAAYFVASYEAVSLGRHGALALSTTDGVLVVWRSGDAISTVDQPGMALATSGSEVATAVTTAIDGVKRYIASSRLYGFPLVVSSGVALSEVAMPVEQSARTYRLRAYSASAAAVVVFTLLTYLAFQLATSRRRASEAQQLHAERIEHLAYHDTLTALPNRSLFSRLLTAGLQQAHRNGNQLAVLFFDLDRFKQINDTLGHEVGDELLRQVSGRLTSCLRESDTVARLGGDEFVVLLPVIHDGQDAAVVARKALNAIAQAFVVGEHELRVTTSIGISVYPQDGCDEQTLTKHADIAMYHAKENGKNALQFYSQDLNRNSLERLALESGLRQALARNQFRLYYQAKRDLKSGYVTGAEALLRWHHPDLGVLLPAQFIPLAEETGLIVEIGKWVIRQACLQSVAWQAQGLSSVSVAVNLSSRQFADEALLTDVLKIVEETGADPSCLELEITESLLMQDVARAVLVLATLKERGIRIAIDDFGTGYSSLSTLKQFPLDSVKIDRSFISGIGSSDSGADVALTEAIIAMGKALQLTVVAEGVECGAQEEFLRSRLCDQYQGYYINKPLDAVAFIEVLRAGCAPNA